MNSMSGFVVKKADGKNAGRMKKVGIGAMSVLALTLVSCSSDGGSNASGGGNGDGASVEVHPEGDYNPVDRDQLQDGGELRLPLGELSEQQNTLHANMVSDTSTVWDWYNPQLTIMDDKGEVEFNPNYFDSVSSEEVDGKTVVTYNFTDEATFNDGTRSTGVPLKRSGRQ